jgi:hypothetical protein
MKRVSIFAAVALAISVLSPTWAQAAGIPLSHCESTTGNLPPANGSDNWSENHVCNDFIYPLGGRTFFFQENQSAENKKDHSYIYTYELYVQDAAKSWKDLGKAPRLVHGVLSYSTLTNFVETSQGLFLGGLFMEKDIGVCGQAACKVIQQYGTIKIDASNHVSKVTFPSLAGSDKSPGTPFASGTPNLVYFAQTQGLITTFGKKGLATSSGTIVKKGTAVIFNSLDLTTNKLSPLPQLTSMASESGVPAIGTFGSSSLLFNPSTSKIFQLFPSGKMSDLAWNTNAVYQPIKDGIVSTVENSDSIIFHLTSGENRTCDYAGGTSTLPNSNPNIIIDAESIKGSTSENTVQIPFYLGFTAQENVIRINPDCSYTFNDFGNDSSATKKFIDNITHQVSGQGSKGEILRMFTPDGYVFDKVLAASYQAAGETKEGYSGPRITCTLDQAKVAKMVSGVFAGTNYVEWKVNPTAIGSECKYPGPQKFKINFEALSISVHYIPNSETPAPTPSPTEKSSLLQAAGAGDAKWPAKCPAVTDTVGGALPKISGYKFDGAGGENYMRLTDGGSTAVTSAGNLLGCYADIPSLNGAQGNAWHIGTINRDASGLYWLNAAGVRWGLTLEGTILVTDKGNPYYSTGHQFITY